MNLLALKVFLLSRLFLGSFATILLLLAAIAFNWMDTYNLVRSGLVTSIEWVDTLNEWGSKTQHTAEKVNEAINKAQQEFQK